MTDYLWPDDLVPYSVDFYLQSHSGGSESPFSRLTKTYGLSAPRWICQMSFRGGYWGETGLEAYGPRVRAFLTKLRGPQNRAAIYDFSHSQMRGDPPAGNSAAAAGATSVSLTGLPSGGKVYAGDYIGGDGRPHIITEDATANSSGVAFVRFEPPLQSAIAADAMTFGNPIGVFRLDSDDAASSQVTVGEGQEFSVRFVEDFYGPAASLLLAEETGAGFAIDFSTSNTGSAVYVRALDINPSASFEGSISAFMARVNAQVEPDVTWPATSVVNANGVTRTTALGEIPYDFSQGARRVKVDWYTNFRLSRFSIPFDTQTLIVRMNYAHASSGSGDILGYITASDGGTFGVGSTSHSSTNAGFRVERYDTSVPFTYTASSGQLADLAVSNAIQIVFTWDSFGADVSINGEPATRVHLGDADWSPGGLLNWVEMLFRPSVPGGSVFYLESIIGLSRRLTATEAAQWGNGAKRHPWIVSALTMGDSHDTSDTDHERMPSLVGLSSTSTGVSLMGFHSQKGSTTALANEYPWRLMQQLVTFDGKNLSSPTTRSVVSYQDPAFTFSTGTGLVGGAETVKRTYGTHAGRLLQVFERAVGGTSSGEFDMMFRYSDDNGTTWSTPVTALDASVLLGAGSLIQSGASMGIEFKSSGLYPNRTLFPIYKTVSGVQRCGVMFTDDDGTSWSTSYGSVNGTNESTAALLPDETVVLVSRVETNNNRRWTTSTNGGATLTDQGLMPSYVGAPAAGTLVQLDPAGVTGTRGTMVMARANYDATVSADRDGTRISFYTNSSMTPINEALVLSRRRMYGYVGGLLPVTVNGQSFYLLAVESSHTSPNYFASSHIVAIRASAVVATPVTVTAITADNSIPTADSTAYTADRN